MVSTSPAHAITMHAAVSDVAGGEKILTPAALDFLAELQRAFGARRDALLERRALRRDEVSRTHWLDFLPETAGGLRGNVRMALLYLESWLRGEGAVGINNLMEDAATAEISRSQIWQWVHNGSSLDDGGTVTADLVRTVVADELAQIQVAVGDAEYAAGMFAEAGAVFESVALDDQYAEFLTLPAYEVIG